MASARIANSQHQSGSGSSSANPASSSRPLAISMKGRIASRAHSFKENILEALGHHSYNHHQHQHQQPQPGNKIGPNVSLKRKVAKKMNSTDNLLDYSNTKESATEGFVREVHLALRYFEVRKNTL